MPPSPGRHPPYPTDYLTRIPAPVGLASLELKKSTTKLVNFMWQLVAMVGSMVPALLFAASLRVPSLPGAGQALTCSVLT